MGLVVLFLLEKWWSRVRVDCWLVSCASRDLRSAQCAGQTAQTAHSLLVMMIILSIHPANTWITYSITNLFTCTAHAWVYCQLDTTRNTCNKITNRSPEMPWQVFIICNVRGKLSYSFAFHFLMSFSSFIYKWQT